MWKFYFDVGDYVIWFGPTNMKGFTGYKKVVAINRYNATADVENPDTGKIESYDISYLKYISEDAINLYYNKSDNNKSIIKINIIKPKLKFN